MVSGDIWYLVSGVLHKPNRLSVICYLYVLTFHRISEIHTRSELVLIICVNRDLVLLIRCLAVPSTSEVRKKNFSSVADDRCVCAWRCPNAAVADAGRALKVG